MTDLEAEAEEYAEKHYTEWFVAGGWDSGNDYNDIKQAYLVATKRERERILSALEREDGLKLKEWRVGDFRKVIEKGEP